MGSYLVLIGGSTLHRGTALAVRQELHPCIIDNTHGEYLTQCTLRLGGEKHSIISCYLPHSWRPEEEYRAALHELQSVMIPSRTILGGDLNAQIAADGESEYVGTHLHRQSWSERGVMLADLAIAFNLCV
eukprot:5002646-Amphidinium_carterae.1